MAPFVEDLSDFLDPDDFAVPVIANGVSGYGILDIAGDLILDDRRTNEDPVIRVETSKFGNLIHGASATVNGVAYTVRESPMLIDDGAFCLVMLTRVVGPVTAARLTTLNGVFITTLSGDYLRIL